MLFSRYLRIRSKHARRRFYLMMVLGSVIYFGLNCSLVFSNTSSANADLLEGFRQDTNAVLRVAERGRENIQVGERTEVHVMSAIHRGDYPVADTFNVLLPSWAPYKNRKALDFVCCFTTSITSHGETPVVEIKARKIRFDEMNGPDVQMHSAVFACSATTETHQRTISRSRFRPLPRIRFRAAPKTNETSQGTFADYRFVAFAETSCGVDMTDVAHEISEPVDKKVAQGDEMAVCMKVAYGEMDPRLLVEWFELAKMVGVSVVQVTYDVVSDKALAVFRHYEEEGFVILASVTPATLKGEPPRSWVKPQGVRAAWTDGWVVVNDCLHRLSRYDYVAVMDFDELLLPADPFTSLLGVMQEAVARFPWAGAFLVESHIVLTEWGEGDPDSPIVFLRRRKRTVSNTLDSIGNGQSSPKIVVRPQRVSYVKTHEAKIRLGYTTQDVPTSLYTFLHYRACKPQRWGNCSALESQDGTELLAFQDQWLQALSQLPLAALGCGQEYASAIARGATNGTKGGPGN